MSPDALLQQFDVMVDAPNGVQKLRELVLQLAVRGKLVPQDPSEEPVSVLLEQISAEKERLFREGKTGKLPTLPPIVEAQVPFEIPQSWAWVRLGAATINRDGERVPVSAEVRGGRRGDYPYYGASGVIDTIDDFLFEKTLLLIGEDGANLVLRSTPIAFLAEGKYWVNNHAHVIDGVSLDLLRYVAVFINALDLKPYVTGTAQPKLNQARLNSIPLALPSLAEQRRIVARVDELMALCDRLEAQQQRRTEVRSRVNRSVLRHLADASADAELSGCWERLRENFHLLYETPEAVAELRQAVLQLAVRGKLVPQDTTDEPAPVLLKRIATEKEGRTRKANTRKPQPLPAITKERFPFDVPDSWEWVRWAQVATDVQYGYTASADATIKDVRLLRITDIQNGHVDWDTVPGCVIDAADVPTYELHEGDLVIARTGGTIGKSYLVPRPTMTAVFASYLIRITPASPMNPRYMLAFARSPVYWKQLLARSAGTGQPNVNGTSLSELLFPLPPVNEQQRIVGKVDELMALCDRLEARLTRACEKSAHLAAAVVHHLTIAS